MHLESITTDATFDYEANVTSYAAMANYIYSKCRSANGSFVAPSGLVDAGRANINTTSPYMLYALSQSPTV